MYDLHSSFDLEEHKKYFINYDYLCRWCDENFYRFEVKED